MATPVERFEEVLDACLDRVLREGEPVEACASRYPEHSAELEPLLRIALESRRVLGIVPSAAARAQARVRFQQAVRQRALRQAQRRPWPLISIVASSLGGVYRQRWAWGMAAGFLFVVISGTGVVAASNGSQPDEALYSVKRAVEQARLAVAFSGDAKARANALLVERRMEEMANMAVKGDKGRVESLSKDVNRNLRAIQKAAMPEVDLPVLDLSTVPEADSLAEAITPKIPPGLAKQGRVEALNRLKDVLEKGRERQEKEVPKAVERAPGKTKEDLGKVHKATQYKYRALTQAIEELTKEE